MAKASQATWGGRFSSGPADLMLRFSESVSFDQRLAPFDIAGSKAHSAMLAHAATQENIVRLRGFGYHLVEPASGSLACGESGAGRVTPTSLARRMNGRRSISGRTPWSSSTPLTWW